MIKFLSGATGAYLESGAAQSYGIGLMIQPGNSYHRRLHMFGSWAADNGAFSEKLGFQPKRFRRMLARQELAEARERCLFVTAPDVLVVRQEGGKRVVRGNARATLDQFPAWAEEIRSHGFPVALVAQDGLETMLDEVPWHLVDVLFIGGGDDWKEGRGALACVRRAQAEGKRTHMGRVGGYRRLALANSWGVDTADGTYLGYGPNTNLPILKGWLDAIRGCCRQQSLSGDPEWTR